MPTQQGNRGKGDSGRRGHPAQCSINLQWREILGDGSHLCGEDAETRFRSMFPRVKAARFVRDRSEAWLHAQLKGGQPAQPAEPAQTAQGSGPDRAAQAQPTRPAQPTGPGHL